MKKDDVSIVFIDDDIKFKEDPVLEEARELFLNVEFISDSNKAMNYINEHFSEKMIIVLDMKFSGSMPNGGEVLKKVRDLTHLIPVIIWSGNDVDKNELSNLFENKAFAFVSKSSSSAELIDTIIKAYSTFKNTISCAIEDWIKVHPEESLSKPFITSLDGKMFTLGDILTEIRMQTPMGLDMAKKLNNLTIDLLMRNKETL
ncbi:MAG: response regulator [bacterium]